MSYDANNLSVLAYANGFTLWHYRTDDNAEDVIEELYFDGASDMLRQGDMILSNLEIDGIPKAAILLVAENVATPVIHNLTPSEKVAA